MKSTRNDVIDNFNSYFDGRYYIKRVDVRCTNKESLNKFLHLIKQVNLLIMAPVCFMDIMSLNRKILTIRYNRMNSTLEKLVESINLDENIGYFIKICEIVKSFKSSGIYHGNLKLSNILFDDISIHIVDFGLNSIRDINNLLYDYYYYISPEQINGKEVTYKTDIYNLGCILYYIVSKHHYYSDPTYKTIVKISKPGERTVSINLQYHNVIESMLKYNPNERIALEEVIPLMNIGTPVDKELQLQQVKDDRSLIKLLQFNCYKWCFENSYDLDLSNYIWYRDNFNDNNKVLLTDMIKYYSNKNNNTGIRELFTILNMVWGDSLNYYLLKIIQPHILIKEDDVIFDKLMIDSVNANMLNLSYKGLSKNLMSYVMNDLHRFTFLREVNFSDSNIDSESTLVLCKCLDSLPNIRLVNIEHNPIGTEGWKYLSEKLNLLTYFDYDHKKTALHANGTHLDNTGLHYISVNLSTITNVEIIAIGENYISDDDSAIKEFCENCTQLNRLSEIHLAKNSDGIVGESQFTSLKNVLTHLEVFYDNRLNEEEDDEEGIGIDRFIEFSLR